MDKTLLERFRKAYRDLELFPLITAEQIEAFRVEYGNDTIARLEQIVEDAPSNGKVIFAGHRGCGKSTLLAKFARQMRQQGHFTVFFSIADLVEMSDVNHVNILYAIALVLLSRATERQVEIPETTKDTLLDWLTTTQTQTITKDLKAEMGVGVDLFKVLSTKLKTEDTFRAEIRKTYERKISELTKKADQIAALIKAATNKEVLVIIDDLDKLDLELVNDIYRDNINALLLPNFRIIFTIPISVIRDIDLRTILQTASGNPIQQMEVAKFYRKEERHSSNAVPNQKKVELFLEVLKKRIPADLIEPGIAERMVLNSGGVMRELVRLARACCSQCLLLIRSEPDRETIKINQEVLHLAMRDLRNDFAASLGENRYNILATTYQNAEPKEITDPEFLILLHGLYVLEYRNDDVWYDVHPIVVDLLRRRNLVT